MQIKIGFFPWTRLIVSVCIVVFLRKIQCIDQNMWKNRYKVVFMRAFRVQSSKIGGRDVPPTRGVPTRVGDVSLPLQFWASPLPQPPQKTTPLTPNP